MPNFLDEVLLARSAYDSGQAERFAARLRGVLEDVRRETLQRLKAMDAFTDQDGKLVDTTATRFAMKAILADVDDLIKEAEQAQVEALKGARETAFRRGFLDSKMAVDSATDAEVEATFNLAFKRAAKVASQQELLGVRTSKAFRGLSKGARSRANSILTSGVIHGDSIGDIADRISRSFETSKRTATQIARTNVNFAVNTGSKAFYDSNPDVFSGYRWDATLDSRTSTICAALHGTFYPLGSEPPGPPAHPNCRSVLVGVFKDEDLEAEVQEGTRFARDEEGRKHKVPADIKFESWLRDQDEQLQKGVLGDDIKLDLWRRRMIGLDDVVAPDLSVRSTEEVVRRAFTEHPNDQGLKNLAGQMEVSRYTKAELARKERREMSSLDFSLGTKPGLESKVNRIRERIDALKAEKLKDSITRTAEREGRGKESTKN